MRVSFLNDGSDSINPIHRESCCRQTNYNPGAGVGAGVGDVGTGVGVVDGAGVVVPVVTAGWSCVANKPAPLPLTLNLYRPLANE